MKKTLAILLTIMVLGGSLLGQTLVENPKRPPNKNAGRIVPLDEVLRIRDNGDEAVFRSPQQLSLGDDGSLYFLDYAVGTNLYCYGPDGKLVFKALKSGQGPGECKYPSGYFFDGNTIRVPAWIPPKIMDFSLGGRYLKEAKIEEDTHGLWFLGTAEGKIYGIRDEVFRSSAFSSSGIFSITNLVYEISSNFKTWKKLFEFPVRMVIKRRTAVRQDMIDATIRGKFLYILHTAEYRVVKYDLRAAKVDRIITRAYDRVKASSSREVNTDPETRGIDFPSDPYLFDIREIHAVGENLWIFTSVYKPNGDDQQVDVFDATGRFIDNFFLRFPTSERNHTIVRRKALIADDGYIFIPEQEEDGLVTIGKYKMRDLNFQRD
jgi:hypothetical protein